MHRELFLQWEECKTHFPPTGADKLCSLVSSVKPVWPELTSVGGHQTLPKTLLLKLVSSVALYGTLQEFQLYKEFQPSQV